jgi:hypothetical protein
LAQIVCLDNEIESAKVIGELVIVEEIGKMNRIDFLVLFADDSRLYVENGYQRVANLCRWTAIPNSKKSGGVGGLLRCKAIKHEVNQ